MPQVQENTVPGYASCYNPRCPGYEQEEVPVLRREAFYMREEVGGDIPGVDHSKIEAVDQSVDPCPYCRGPRIAAFEKRPDYPPISGQDPLALLDLNNQKQLHQQQVASLEQDKALLEMRAQMAEMQAELQRRRGGRPPKDGE